MRDCCARDPQVGWNSGCAPRAPDPRTTAARAGIGSADGSNLTPRAPDPCATAAPGTLRLAGTQGALRAHRTHVRLLRERASARLTGQIWLRARRTHARLLRQGPSGRATDGCVRGFATRPGSRREPADAIPRLSCRRRILGRSGRRLCRRRPQSGSGAPSPGRHRPVFATLPGTGHSPRCAS